MDPPKDSVNQLALLASRPSISQASAQLVYVGKDKLDQLLELYQKFALTLVHERIVKGKW